ncbi:hypothetical protein HCN44_002921 [Aphidius gifuensis]|uniref:Uncharacterized protein n=1 Tax=Aphidius gifuensis TaxID=684658 RepID=A0A834XU98_APHGI|nr:putative leucine-rich repeat-containing protein DDB_G0290503 [Aphidius gifuensis]KAF7991359.1 hypothetical protein HCN44_002921 [Aphidius gifuensis]
MDKYRRRAKRFEDLPPANNGKESSPKPTPKIYIDSFGKTSAFKDITHSPSTQYMSIKIPSSPYVRRDIHSSVERRKFLKSLSNNSGTNDSSEKLTLLSEQKIHMNGCSYNLTNMCLCKDVMVLEKRQRERSIKIINQDSNQELPNTTIEGSILAGDLVGLHYRNEIENSPCNSTELYGDSSYYSDISSKESVTNTASGQYLKPLERNYNNKYDTSSSCSSQSTSAAYLADVSNSDDLSSFESQAYQTLVTQYSDEKSQPINPFLRRLVKQIDSNNNNEESDDDDNDDKPDELFTKLSQSYIKNPNEFTGKLLSILETSCIDDEEKCDLSKKYANICDNIQEEILANEHDKLPVEITEDYTDLGVSITLDHSSISDDKNILNNSFLIEEDEVNRSIMIEAVKKRNTCYEIKKEFPDDNNNDDVNNKNKRNSINEIKTSYNFNKIKNMFEMISKTNDYCSYLNEHKKNIRDVTTRIINDKKIDVDHQKSKNILSPSVGYLDVGITKETPAAKLALRNAQGLKNNWISPTYLKKNSATSNDKQVEFKKSYSIDSGKNTLTPSFSDDSDKSLDGWKVFGGRKKTTPSPTEDYHPKRPNDLPLTKFVNNDNKAPSGWQVFGERKKIQSTSIRCLNNEKNTPGTWQSTKKNESTVWQVVCGGGKPIESPVGQYIRGDDSKLIPNKNVNKIGKSTEV